MRNKLGISIYPDKADLIEIEEYIKLASNEGFGLVFINLIEVLESKNELLVKKFKNTISLCKENNMKVTLDVNKSTFETIGLNFKNPDLKFFKDLGADVLRLDEAFDGIFEATLTFNPYNIIIELNPSTMSYSIENILSYKANVQNLQLLHNFYPQNLTGLSYQKFKETNKRLRKNGIKIGSFVTITDHKSVGPWDVSDNLPTLELHRKLPLGIQANHLFSNNQSEYVYISTQFATKENLKEVKEWAKFKKVLKYDLAKGITETEKSIIDFNNHIIRGDVNDYILRSTETRKIFKDKALPARIIDEKIIKRGMLVIPNETYLKYKGELQIVIKDFINDGKRNVVGVMKEEHMFLLDELCSWDHFEVK